MSKTNMNRTIVGQLYDKEFRMKLRKNTAEHIKHIYKGSNSDLNSEKIEYLVKTNTKDSIYFVIPEMDYTLKMDDISRIDVAGKTVGSLGCAGSVASASTVFTISGSASSFGSASSASSIATAGTKEV